MGKFGVSELRKSLNRLKHNLVQTTGDYVGHITPHAKFQSDRRVGLSLDRWNITIAWFLICAMLASAGISYRRVSVCAVCPVCHKSVFYWKG